MGKEKETYLQCGRRNWRVVEKYPYYTRITLFGITCIPPFSILCVLVAFILKYPTPVISKELNVNNNNNTEIN